MDSVIFKILRFKILWFRMTKKLCHFCWSKLNSQVPNDLLLKTSFEVKFQMVFIGAYIVISRISTDLKNWWWKFKIIFLLMKKKCHWNGKKSLQHAAILFCITREEWQLQPWNTSYNHLVLAKKLQLHWTQTGQCSASFNSLFSKLNKTV